MGHSAGLNVRPLIRHPFIRRALIARPLTVHARRLLSVMLPLSFSGQGLAYLAYLAHLDHPAYPARAFRHVPASRNVTATIYK
jgi:hypothetical protein